MMTLDQAYALARKHALAEGDQFRSHDYLPQSKAQAAVFMPHQWVIAAIMDAAAQPQQSETPMSDVKIKLVVGERYYWRPHPAQLIYLGCTKLGWYRFEKVDEPGVVWWVRDADLAYFKEAK